MNLRTLVVACFFVLSVPALISSTATPCAAIEVADLEDQLRNGLRARTPAQLAFINRVVTEVRANRLPVRMVYAMFKYARPKKPHPFPYFQEGLRRQAARIGVAL